MRFGGLLFMRGGRWGTWLWRRTRLPATQLGVFDLFGPVAKAVAGCSNVENRADNRHLEPRQVAPDRGIEIELSRIDELHDRKRGKGLAERADDHRRLNGHRTAGRSGDPKGVEVGDLVALHDAEREPGDAKFRHLFGDP